MRPTRQLKKYVLLVTLLVVCAGIVGCPEKDAAVAINKYGNSLDAFQQAVIKWHGQKNPDGSPKIDDALYRKILEYDKMAATAGKALNTGIQMAASGASPQNYIDAANQAFTDLTNTIPAIKDPTTRQGLQVMVDASAALLKNAISLVQAVKPAKTTGQMPQSHPWAWLALFLPLMALSTVDLGKIIQLLSAITQLEPIAFDLVVKLADQLKGKSAAEVEAMNEAIFNKVISDADAELAKLPPEGGGTPPAAPAAS